MFPMLLQSVFSSWADSWRNFWADLDYVLFWGIIILVLGVILLFVLIFFTEFKRKERDSVKFSAIIAVIASILMAIGLNAILVANGFW
jgi:MFS superfamily sulfate permease-like transporter